MIYDSASRLPTERPLTLGLVAEIAYVIKTREEVAVDTP
jgi:hypothetical protein